MICNDEILWAIAKSVKKDHRFHLLEKKQLSYHLRRQKGIYLALVLRGCVVQTEVEVLAEAETTQCYGPIWMSELCSMCGKMAIVQGLESFIFC